MYHPTQHLATTFRTNFLNTDASVLIFAATSCRYLIHAVSCYCHRKDTALWSRPTTETASSHPERNTKKYLGMFDAYAFLTFGAAAVRFVLFCNYFTVSFGRRLSFADIIWHTAVGKAAYRQLFWRDATAFTASSRP
jgi:hypothetical protein